MNNELKLSGAVKLLSTKPMIKDLSSSLSNNLISNPKERVSVRRTEDNRSRESKFQKTYREVAKANDRSRSVENKNRRNVTDNNKTDRVAERREHNRVDSNTDRRDLRRSENNRNNVVEKNSRYDKSVEDNEVSDDDVKKVKKENADELDILLDQLVGVSADGELVTESQDQSWLMVRQSLTAISATLNINIPDDLQNLQGGEPSEDVVSQFADILETLKSLSGLLEKAVDDGVDLEMQDGKVKLDKSQMVSMEKTLRVETFKLEMAFESLGVSGSVAEKMNSGNASGNGIPVAVDPSTLSMPESQIEQVFGDLVENGEEQIESIVARLSELAKNDKDSKKSKIPGDLSALKANSAKKETPDLSFQGAHVMSKLSANDSDVLSQVNGVEKGTNNLLQSAKMQSNSLQANKIAIDVTNTVSQFESKISIQPNGVGFASKVAGIPFKNMEESVMAQVVDRVKNAINTGTNEVRIHLRPESLGDVQLKIQIEGDVVTAKINVENQQVKQIIENNFQQLKDSLAEHNLQAGAFDVNVDKRSNQEAGNTGGKKNRRSNSVNGIIGTEHSEDESIGMTAIQTETGRRFGNNSVEYFA